MNSQLAVIQLCRMLGLICVFRKVHTKMQFKYYKTISLTLNLLTTSIVATPSNASKWQMGFNLPFKGCMKTQQIHQLFIQFINYVWQLLHVFALHCHLQVAFLVPSERCSIEEQSIEYCGWACSV